MDDNYKCVNATVTSSLGNTAGRWWFAKNGQGFVEQPSLFVIISDFDLKINASQPSLDSINAANVGIPYLKMQSPVREPFVENKSSLFHASVNWEPEI
jgi:hypothetical protein